MAFPRFEASIFEKGSAPRGAGPLGAISAEGPWLHVLLALAVTMLISVLPFKAPSVSPVFLTTLAATSSIETHAHPVIKDAVKLAHQKLAPTHGHLKVAKKPQRKSWDASLDLASSANAPRDRAVQAAAQRPYLRDALATRASPRFRLRDPPALG